MRESIVKLAVTLSGVALLGSSRTASADEVVVQQPNVAKERVETTGPNRALLHSGIWILVLSYVPAVIVAAESHRYGDKNLYIPIAGPWMDLAVRERCAPNVSCSNETVNKVLLVVDGVFQGLGALNLVGAFLFPETRTSMASSSPNDPSRGVLPSIRLVPAKVGANSFGVAAVGSF